MLIARWMNRIIFLGLVFAFCADAFARNETPKSIELNDGAEIHVHDGGLVLVDLSHRKKSLIRLPVTLEQAIATASGIKFPANRSHMIDGNEYFLLVVTHSSKESPMGYCGAGEEGTLYVLRIKGVSVSQRFEMPVQSCLVSMSLDDGVGNKSPYLAIEWEEGLADFRVAWSHYPHVGRLIKTYRYNNSTFVEMER